MINELSKCANEISIGYDDCYGEWHIRYGCRGSSSHVDGCGKSIYAAYGDFSKAVKFFYEVICLGMK